MKTKTIALIAVIGGGLYLANRTKKMAEAVGVAMRPPLPANSGPVVNGLSDYELAGYELAGWGKKLKKAAHRASRFSPSAAIARRVQGVVRDPRRLVTAPVRLLHRVHGVVRDPRRLVTAPVRLLNRLPGGSRLPLVRRLTRGQTRAESAPANAEVVYEDDKGNVITKEQYDALIAENARIEAENAAANTHRAPPTPTHRPPGYNPRPNEELNIRSTEGDDYGGTRDTKSDDYGGTRDTKSDDYGGTQHTASPAGSPALPVATASVETPAPVIDPVTAPPAPKSNTPALVGTALVATAAFFAFR